MFNRIAKEQVFQSFENRLQPISKIDKVAVSDPDYLFFVSHFQDTELTPDISLFGYEQALNENRYLSTHYPGIAEMFWMIGTSGQGDSWFLHKQQLTVHFYDHDRGEYEQAADFTPLHIGFTALIQLGLLYRQLEQYLDDAAIDQASLEAEFVTQVNSLHPELYNTYPFRYFDNEL